MASYIIEDNCSFGYLIGGILPVIPFSFGIFEICVMLFIFLIFRFESLFKSIFRANIGVRETATLFMPIYYLVAYYSIIVGILIGIVSIIGISSSNVPYDFVKWILIRFCSESLAVFFLQNGIGSVAIKRSLTIGTSWSLFSGSVPLLTYYSSPQTTFKHYNTSRFVFTVIICVFYFFLWVIPQKFLHYRPALKRYALLKFLILFIQVIYELFIIITGDDSCVTLILSEIPDCCHPFIILYAIRQDTLFWQGLYQSPEGGINEPLLGIWELGRETINLVADTISELERKVVPIISYTQLQVDKSKFVAGGTARVYRGMFQSKDVAIKFLFHMDLTPSHVVSFIDEATILHSLAHPNIVKCYGVSVMPPALCLVTEFCEYGSLYDFLRMIDIIYPDDLTIENSWTERSTLNRLALTNAYNANISVSTHSSERRPHTRSIDTNSLTNPLLQNSHLVSDENMISRNSVKRMKHSISQTSLGNPVSDNSSVLSISSSRSSRERFSIMLPSSFNSSRSDIRKRDHLSESFGSSSSSNYRTIDTLLSSFQFGLGTTQKNQTVANKNSDSINRIEISSKQSPRPSFSTIAKSFTVNYSDTSNVINNIPLFLRFAFARDAAAGVAYMHSKGLMHCDIKSLNFLVTKDFVLKLADLGEARPIAAGGIDASKLPKNLNWSAPEILLNEPLVNQSSDVWSLSFVFSEIFTGNIPFDTKEYRELPFEHFIDNLKADSRPEIPNDIFLQYPWFDDMLSKAWAYDSKKRISAQSMIEIFETHMLKTHKSVDKL